MRIHLVNPSDVSFGTAVITPRWLYVLAAATPDRYDAPAIIDETLEPFDPETLPGDVVGIGIHTATRFVGITWAARRMREERSSSLAASTPPSSPRGASSTERLTHRGGDGDIVWARC